MRLISSRHTLHTLLYICHIHTPAGFCFLTHTQPDLSTLAHDHSADDLSQPPTCLHMLTDTHCVVPFISPSRSHSYSLLTHFPNNSQIRSWESGLKSGLGLNRVGPFKVIHLAKHHAIHKYRINIHSLKERGSVKTDAGTQGIVTRCRGGNTWSILCCRNVFISLFTNVAILRCVHYKVQCRLDHSIKQTALSMENLCRA